MEKEKKEAVLVLQGNNGNVEKKNEGSHVGSPEVQAKTDGTIKDIEKKTGTRVGEPARQAIYDGIGTGAASAEE